MYSEEKAALEDGKPGKGGLMTSFLRTDQQLGKIFEGDRLGGLTVEEISGNIFFINFSGYDIMAKTFAYTMLLLDCASRGARMGGGSTTAACTCRRTMGIRYLVSKAQAVQGCFFPTLIDKKTIIIPTHTGVITVLLAKSHTSTILGRKKPSSNLPKELLSLSLTAKNWPGAKFSQVEFVAVIARSLRDHRYTAVQWPDENLEDTRK
ncbi:hypothetical protein TSTA_019390 [Talaromyces stipitatus ATCC 10500]|uniref:Uncharacterized protein n=1 Tax=Talaromyces stipitatus (strain ATCC 10500 / CBS 375.48 / QM 6759 / NRRL 1006) TaxID=441959 RepID=B8MH62_TALSN|nr:uncharacterized protein TSTA_019390 [Talaromyces stipitatus ATCC 10500]EED16876.1 hypothetical protein TSTA_019390 [Talaromyces stipitatus ATCC 10500]